MSYPTTDHRPKAGKTNPEGSLILAETEPSPLDLNSKSTKGKFAVNKHQPTPQTGMNRSRRPTRLIGIDFWHAVEFSSVGHAPSLGFRRRSGATLHNLPRPARPSKSPSHLAAAAAIHFRRGPLGNWSNVRQPAVLVQIGWSGCGGGCSHPAPGRSDDAEREAFAPATSGSRGHRGRGGVLPCPTPAGGDHGGRAPS